MQIKVAHVHSVTAKGRVYHYHRPTGTRLKSPPGTPEFFAEVDALNLTVEPKPIAGTLGDLVEKYRGSPEFLTLAPRTRSDYQRVFDFVKPLRACPVVDITQRFVTETRNRAFKAHKRRFANYVVQVLSVLLGWGTRNDHCTVNAAAGVKLVRRPRDSRKVNRAWSGLELDKVLSASPVELRGAILLGVFFRQGDVLRLTWNCYDGHAIELRQGKTGTTVWVPCPAELRAVLDSTKRESPTIVLGKRGKPFTGSGFRARFYKIIRALTKAETVAPGLTFHGLRHSAGKLLADAGCDTRTIAAVLGHATEHMAAHYSKEADQRRRAVVGIKAWERNRNRTVKPQRTKV